MEYLPEILKIVNGALNADIEKVVNYTELLSEKLEAIGDKSASSKLTINSSEFSGFCFLSPPRFRFFRTLRNVIQQRIESTKER
mgnify:CR=1 FL=1